MPCGSSKESGNQDRSGENGHCAFEDLDHSVLQQPLNLGVTNVKQILKCIQSGSKEVKDIVLNECNIIYECKACDGLFRSLANFMYHKRCYCKRHLCEDMVLFQKFEEEEEIITVNPEAPVESPEKTLDNHAEISNLVDHTVDLEKTEITKKMESPVAKGKAVTETPSTAKGKNATPSGDKVKAKSVPEKTESSMISRRTRNKNAQPAVKIIMTEDPPIKCQKLISARIMRKNSGEKSTAARNKKERPSDNTNKDAKTKKVTMSKFPVSAKKLPPFPKVLFKTIDSNPHAVYQSSDKKKLSSFGVASNSALETKADKNKEDKLILVLKKDGKSHNSTTSKSSSKNKSEMEKLSDFHLTRRKRLLSRNDCNVQELRCLTCKTQFMSLKTLYFHMLSLHSKKRLYYPCPFCKTLFVQMYGVSRHLISIHNKTKEQISKMRDMIKKKSVWKRIDDVNLPHDTNISPLNYQLQPQSPPEVKVFEPPKPVKVFEPPKPVKIVVEPPKSVVSIIESKKEIELPQNVIKVGKNVTLHQCAKCSRVFGRKSSQVSHEKFCIMNSTIKKENVDDPSSSEPVSPVVSFLALPAKSAALPLKSAALPPQPNPPKPACVLQITKQENKEVVKPVLEIPRNLFDVKLSDRPKRRAEKQMHKDFVNSQTLKWRSANRVDTNISNKTPPPVKKKIAKTLEKKVHGFMDAESLNCLKCDKKFSSYSNLRRHVAIHVGWTRFKCKYCDYQAYNKSQCWSHIQKAHAVEEGVEDDDIGKCIVNLVNSCPPKKVSEQHTQYNSKCNEVSKKFSVKHNSLSNKKMSKKKIAKHSKHAGSGKKKEPNVKKERLDLEKEVQSDSSENKVAESKREVVHTVLPIAKFAKKDVTEIKKAKTQAAITITKLPKQEDVDSKEKPHAMITIQKFPKKETIDKKEKTQHIIPIQKLTMSDYKRDSNYKSVTTSNPTTIILSKKIPSSSVQSIVTISPESMSSPLKISPIRTSPRKSEIRSPEDKLITTLVTRSPVNTKITPIQIKLQGRTSSIEGNPQDSSDQNCHKKERLISEWFPKKDLSSTTIRRVSAPLIIGLAPASNAGVSPQAKNSVIAFEKSSH